MDAQYPDFPDEARLCNLPFKPQQPSGTILLLDALFLHEGGPRSGAVSHWASMKNGPDGIQTCPICELPKDPTQVRHVCRKRCPDCDEWYSGRGNKAHSCRAKVMRKMYEDALSAGLDRTMEERREECEKIASCSYDDTERYQEFEAAFLQGASILLNGDGGTGKSELILRTLEKHVWVGDPANNMRRCEDLQGDSIAFVCPRAVAAKRFIKWDARGSFVGTIHSLICLKPGETSLEAVLGRLRNPTNVERWKRLKDLKLLIIDEVSTLDETLLKILSDVIRTVNFNQSGTPFADVQIILLGDWRQMPAINSPQPIFAGQLFNVIDFTTIVLRRIHRVVGLDEDSKRLVHVQAQMARGCTSERNLLWLHKRCRETAGDRAKFEPDRVFLLRTNEAAQRQNNKIVHRNPMSVTIYHATGWPCCGVQEYQGWVAQQNPSNADKARVRRQLSFLLRLCCRDLHICVGARVMLTSNHLWKRYKVGNGSRGRVTAHSAAQIFVQFDDVEESVPITPIKLVGTSVKQFPLLLAYYLTIAKVQGLSLGKVTLDMESDDDNLVFRPRRNFTLSAGLYYVAVSRAKRIDDLKIRGTLMMSHIVSDEASLRYADELERSSPQKPSDIFLQTRILSLLHRGAFPLDEQEEPRFVVGKWGRTPTLSRRVARVGAKVRFHEPWDCDEKDEGPWHHSLNKFIAFDCETHGKKVLETVYSVGAELWRRNKRKQTKLWSNWSLDGKDPFNAFMVWLESILEEDFLQWEASTQRNPSKEDSAPYILSGFNSSGFDLHWLLQYISHGKSEASFKQYQMQYLLRGNQVVIFNLIRQSARSERTKVCLKSWDPFLFFIGTLDKVSKGLLRSSDFERIGSCKSFFPHNYITEVGPEVAFAGDEPTRLCVSKYFPNKDPWAWFESLELQLSREDDWVDFPLRSIHDKYLRTDVELVTALVVSADRLIFNEALPGRTILDFPTVASLTTFGFIASLPDELRINFNRKKSRGDRLRGGEVVVDEGEAETDEQRCNRLSSLLPSHNSELVHTRIYRLTLDENKRVRKGNYGGKSLPRVLHWVSSQLAILKLEPGPLTKEDYKALTEFLLYFDFHSMYGSVMATRLFPTGPHVIIIDPRALEMLLQQLRDKGQDGCPFFIMELDRTMNKHDLDPPIARRGPRGQLLWDLHDAEGCSYTSVDIAMGMRRGITFSNPTWAIVWGKQGLRGEWTFEGQKHRIFERWMKTCAKLKSRGGVVGVLGKILGNATYGAMLKRDHKAVCKNITSSEEYEKVMSDPSLVVTYERYIESSQTSVVQLEQVVNEGSELSKNASHLGAFILSYSHVMLDDALLTANPLRMSGLRKSVFMQPITGDTDSIIMHRKHCTPEFLHLCGEKPGMLGDDLSKLSKLPSFLPQGSCKLGCRRVDPAKDYCIHELQMTKVLRQESPQPKLYGQEVLAAGASSIQELKPKSKGISTGALMSEAEYVRRFARSMGVPVMANWRNGLKLVAGASATQKRKFHETLPTNQDLTQAMMKKARTADEGGVVCVMQNRFKSDTNKPRHGNTVFAKYRTTLRRTVMKNKWTGRVLFENSTSHTVPHGWELREEPPTKALNDEMDSEPLDGVGSFLKDDEDFKAPTFSDEFGALNDEIIIDQQEIDDFLMQADIEEFLENGASFDETVALADSHNLAEFDTIGG